MASTVRRLEQMLVMWEDTFFLMYALAKSQLAQGIPLMIPLAGPVVHAPEFRKYLLDRTVADFDKARFIGPPEVYNVIRMNSGSAMLHHPMFLKAWSQNSRRVYHLTADLQVLLGHTSLNGVHWPDVHWPFDSFVVSLETPIIDKNGHRFDCIIFAKVKDFITNEEAWGFLLLSDKFEGLKIFDQFTRSQTNEYIRKGKWDQLIHTMQRAVRGSRKRFGEVCGSIFFIDPKNTALTIDETNEKTTFGAKLQEDQLIHGPGDYPHPEWTVTARLVVGLVLYLSTLPTGSPHRSEWKRAKPGKPDPHVITSEAEVCSVTTSFTLTADEHELVRGFKKSGNYELCAHFRTGYWRRPPGKGSDPEAKKTIWVRPTLVRADRLKPGEQPAGAMTVVQ
jgi:hypothetical protein